MVRSFQHHRRRFIVLDRDGTLIEEREYLSEPDQVKLIPGAAAALREFRQMGFGLVMITNQSGIGRGLLDYERLQSIHQRFEYLLDVEGVRLDGIYVCPHVPDDDCACSKPKLGLLEKAADDLDFDMWKNVVIGEKAYEIDMGRAAGAMTILVKTGFGKQFATATSADFVVDDLADAARTLRRIVDGPSKALD